MYDPPDTDDGPELTAEDIALGDKVWKGGLALGVCLFVLVQVAAGMGTKEQRAAETARHAAAELVHE